MMQKYPSGEIVFIFDIRRKLPEAMIYTFWHAHQLGQAKWTFIFQASKDWNNLDNDIKNNKSTL